MAASLGLPASAFAKMTTGVNTNGPNPNAQLQNYGDQLIRDRNVRAHDMAANGTGAAIGGGMDAGNEIGHTTGPGNAPIDDSTRGPINDVQAGRGSADTLQSRNPRPIQQQPPQ
jgi:hypothetical protein